jgi:hypothetical protein
MSAIQMIIANIESLNEAARAEVFAHFALREKVSAGPIKEIQVKAPNKNKGVPTCHGDYTRMILETQKDALAAFKEANPEVKGAHLVFVSVYTKEHAAEYAAFEAAWKEEHPKREADLKPQADLKPLAELKPLADLKPLVELKPEADLKPQVDLEEAGGAPIEAEVKPKRIISEEQKAKMKAGREAALAKKKALAAAPVAELPDGEEAIVIVEEPVASASTAASSASSSGKSQGKKRGPKPMTEEEKAAKKAAKAAKALGLVCPLGGAPERPASPKEKAE